jgi:hypothetical protein
MAWRLTVHHACDFGNPVACRCQVLPPLTERYAAGLPPGDTRGHTLVPSIGNTQSVSGSRGCSTIGKPIEPTDFGIDAPMSTQRSDGRSSR